MDARCMTKPRILGSDEISTSGESVLVGHVTYKTYVRYVNLQEFLKDFEVVREALFPDPRYPKKGE